MQITPSRCRMRRCAIVVIMAAAGLAGLPSRATAQVGGIAIDSEGVVQPALMTRESAAQARRRAEAFTQEHLDKDLQAFSEQRCVSLRALEAEVVAAGSLEDLPLMPRYCFGLQRIDAIYLDTEGHDVWLCGPAEGFAPDAVGRMIGTTTGRPPLRLEDLMVALRWRDRQNRDMIGCSIDPTAAGLAAMQRYVAGLGAASSNDVAHARTQEMARILGRQTISVFGVQDDSHFAQVLVEADYRMKLIALGKETPAVRGIRSQLALATPQGNSLQRWWFIPWYDPITVDGDRTAYGLSGARAQLLAQEQWSDIAGRRTDAPFTRHSTEKFAELFTDHFAELADATPAFAELQSVFDIAVLVELAHSERFYDRVGWEFAALRDGARYPTPTYPVPREADSLATSVRKSRYVIGVVGGVTLDTASIVRQPFREHAAGDLAARRTAAAASRSRSAAEATGNPRGWWNAP